MGSDSILAGIGATVLAVTLLVCGFAACCLPVTTASLAGAVSTGADSPYTHEQLVSLAQETRAFTVDAHSSMEEARESLAADVVAAPRTEGGGQAALDIAAPYILSLIHI